MERKIGFIGLGLIGGSIAKKIKELSPQTRIMATTGRLSTVRRAQKLSLIENDTLLPPEAFRDCSCIFLCAPVQSNLAYLRQLKGVIGPDVLITDVGSTKTDIHKEVKRLSLEGQFIGGHPMTGSEKTGLDNADPDIFVNAYYIVTPTELTPQTRTDHFVEFVRSLGSIPLVLDYQTHDHATAAISHLPHMIAFSLVNLIRESDDETETMKTIAAGGFKDITRIASSSPVMWENICLSNREQILSLMDDFLGEFQKIRTAVASADTEEMGRFFQSAKDYRDSIGVPAAAQSDCMSFYEIYLDLDDEAGSLARVADLLGEAGISIKNLSIVNNREFEEGVLRIEFYKPEAMKEAASLLTEKGYIMHKH